MLASYFVKAQLREFVVKNCKEIIEGAGRLVQCFFGVIEQ